MGIWNHFFSNLSAVLPRTPLKAEIKGVKEETMGRGMTLSNRELEALGGRVYATWQELDRLSLVHTPPREIGQYRKMIASLSNLVASDSSTRFLRHFGALRANLASALKKAEGHVRQGPSLAGIRRDLQALAGLVELAMNLGSGKNGPTGLAFTILYGATRAVMKTAVKTSGVASSIASTPLAVLAIPLGLMALALHERDSSPQGSDRLETAVA